MTNSRSSEIAEGESAAASRAPRSAIGKAATFRSRGSMMTDATLQDLSRTGCRLTSSVAMDVGVVVSIVIQGLDDQAAKIVRSDAKGQGCQFLMALTDEQVDRARVAVPIANAAFPEMRGKVSADATALFQAEPPRSSRWQRMLSVLR